GLSWAPSSGVRSGNSVTFTATIKNQGGTATPSGVTHRVGFKVDGTVVCWGARDNITLGPGESVTLTANGGPGGSGAWSASSGQHSVQAVADDIGVIAESNDNNNTMTKTLSVRRKHDRRAYRRARP